MPRPRLLFLIAVLSFSSPLLAQTTHPATPAPRQATPAKPAQPAAPKPKQAKWDESYKTLFDMDAEQFAESGISKLTEDEFFNLMGWAFGYAEAESKKALAKQLTYSCGPTRLKPEDYDKVRIYLDLPDDTPAELASPIRQGLRAIKDVEIVFSRRDADRAFGFLAVMETVGDNNRPIGYSVNLTVTTPCVRKIADQILDQGFDYEELVTTKLKSGDTNAKEMADRVVTDLDAHEIETVRRSNAAMKKYAK